METMNSRERLKAAWEGRTADHIPLTFQCFGNPVPKKLRWSSGGQGEEREVRRWYTQRLEHIHTLPDPWTLNDEFRRVQAWLSLGVDDLVDVSIPWSVHPEVSWTNTRHDAGQGKQYPVLEREYRTPVGKLRHRVHQTGEELGDGWVIQPAHVSLMEDFNIPRGVEHAVSSPEDVPHIRYLYAPPDAEAGRWLSRRMEQVDPFAREQGVAVQAWAAFGMDAVVWLCGTEGAILLAMDHPKAFGELMEIVTETDLARVELAARQPEIDLIVERGWYSSTEFWSPQLFDRYLLKHVQRLAELCHRRGKKFCYTVTTGVEILGPRLANAGVDVLYFIDPLLDGIRMDRARDLLSSRMCLVGGANAITLATKDRKMIETEVLQAMDSLGPSGRFILHPIDALFPDTPWEGVEMLIEAWEKAGSAG
jgi:uroporphyrinogen-III decarboxylase